MELTCNVWRWNNDGEGWLLLIGVGLEVALIASILVDPILKEGGIVILC